ncbi:hypothetical protein ABZ135_04965 [Streptomyces sp. NPDC006339]|uniref:hypothetical protein n=1 Tax=Streptomyces sp. NPDC006339 TaxID=3156755 RepID=UPI0033B07CD8
MSLHRRLTIATGAALLSLAVAGCSDLGRTAVGTISYETGPRAGQEAGHEAGQEAEPEGAHTAEPAAAALVTSPSVKGCHKLAPEGASRVENGTLVDMRLYATPDCRGGEYTYLPSNSGDEIVPGTPPWRSYSFVH